MRKHLVLSQSERIELNRNIKSNHGEQSPDNLTLFIHRPSGYTINNDIVAVGRYDASNEKWIFESEEESLKQWLEVTFSQPLNSRRGQIPINSRDFVDQVKDTVMTRRGLVMTTKE